MTEEITDSCGNVFSDLGFSADEATVLAMRAALIAELREAIARKGWTQVQAGLELGIGQSRVSDLLRGRREKCSLDMLVTLAMRAGCKVELTVI